MPVPDRGLHVARALAPSILRPRRQDIGQATGAFVRAVLVRHRGRRQALQPLDRAYRRNTFATIFAQHLHRHDHRTTLRLSLGLQPLLRQREVVRPFLAWRARPLSAAPAVPAPRPFDLITRITARERRVEQATTIRALIERAVRAGDRREGVAAPAAPAIRPVAAVPMFVRRLLSPAAARETAAARGPEQPELAGWGPSAIPPRAMSGVTPIPLTPSELSRLTDHVVTAIDRRFIAHRERHGRI
jgi:hypothetical protein